MTLRSAKRLRSFLKQRWTLSSGRRVNSRETECAVKKAVEPRRPPLLLQSRHVRQLLSWIRRRID